ncbi:hypothetical protein L3X38_018293 [Prunus dulcis]|uniref:F-box domain-containing protein n=1 Tax=Prunus dulcis TaxID=3755 RepID=A0AAD4ZAV8_PRUDU|nr:hypothetical protein L3X38_018293 [Prunus dulcis]
MKLRSGRRYANAADFEHFDVDYAKIEDLYFVDSHFSGDDDDGFFKEWVDDMLNGQVFRAFIREHSILQNKDVVFMKGESLNLKAICSDSDYKHSVMCQSVSSHSERYSDEQVALSISLFVQVIGSIARRTASTQEEQHNIPIKGDITYLLQDQISPLPDEILIGILSRLNTREASRTSAISKRWRNLWTHVTCLNFDEDVVQNKRFDQFEISARAKWVTQVLQLHQGSTLDMFRMNRHYSTSVPATKLGSSLRLKFLQVSNCRQLVRVDIFAPNLVEFVYDSRSVYRRGIVLKHAPSLVTVSLAENDESITRAFLSASSCFSCLHTLSLRMNFDLEINMPQEFPELTCLKDLSLEVCNANCGRSLLSLTPLLERSPSLHRLKLQMRWKWNYYKKQSWRDMQKINRCPHHCLKEVKFCGFLGIGPIIDTDFAMYLIESAMVLEKLIVELETRREILPEFKATDDILEAIREHVLQLGTQLPPRAELIII